MRFLGEEAGRAGVTTYASPPGGSPPPGLACPEDLLAAAVRSETGCVLYWSGTGGHLVIPPFHVAQEAVLHGFRLDALRDLFDRPRRICVVLLRLGGFAVGIYENDVLVSSKVGSRFVKGRHSKGGSSQGRFARRRDEQARHLFRKTCEVLRAQIDAYPHQLDHLLTGGDRRTLAAFEKDCPAMRDLEPIRLRRVLDVGDPKKATLDALPRLMYESVVLSVDTSGPEHSTR